MTENCEGAGLQGERRFNSDFLKERRTEFMNGNNCAAKQETGDPRMCRVLWAREKMLQWED